MSGRPRPASPLAERRAPTAGSCGRPRVPESGPPAPSTRRPPSALAAVRSHRGPAWRVPHTTPNGTVGFGKTRAGHVMPGEYICRNRPRRHAPVFGQHRKGPILVARLRRHVTCSPTNLPRQSAAKHPVHAPVPVTNRGRLVPSGGASFGAMMSSANFREPNDAPFRHRLNASWRRGPPRVIRFS